MLFFLRGGGGSKYVKCWKKMSVTVKMATFENSQSVIWYNSIVQEQNQICVPPTRVTLLHSTEFQIKQEISKWMERYGKSHCRHGTRAKLELRNIPSHLLEVAECKYFHLAFSGVSGWESISLFNGLFFPGCFRHEQLFDSLVPQALRKFRMCASRCKRLKNTQFRSGRCLIRFRKDRPQQTMFKLKFRDMWYVRIVTLQVFLPRWFLRRINW